MELGFFLCKNKFLDVVIVICSWDGSKGGHGGHDSWL